MSMDININTSSKLAVTPEFQQSVRILQMNCQELAEYVENLAIENPVIEVEKNYDGIQQEEKFKKKIEWLDSIDEQNRVYYEFPQEQEDTEPRYLSNAAADNECSLQDYLIEQLNLLELSRQEYRIAKYIIQSLDENGYLQENIEYIAESYNTSIEKIEEMLEIVQSFEPLGVGARNLKECLAIQLDNMGEGSDQIYELINNHLEDLSRNKLEFVSKQMKVSIQRIKELYAIVKSLNPRPGYSFKKDSHTGYVTPDIVVVKFKGYYEVLLSDFSIPAIRISDFYKGVLKNSDDRETKKYIEKKIEQAAWVVKCIDKRNSTLLSIAKVVVDVQKEYFDKGPRYVRTMTIKDVADILGIHESTVSRAINGKYLHSSWGIKELKYFFSHGLSGGIKSGVAQQEVKLLLNELINTENRKKPYSDAQIVELLKEHEINLSRRTIAKYREEMGIPGASCRKEK